MWDSVDIESTTVLAEDVITRHQGTHAWCSGHGVLVAWVCHCMALALIPLRCFSGELLVAVIACD